MGLPAIVIPYPFAADDHQATNADYYAQGGGVKVFKEKDLSPELLAQEIQSLLQDHKQLERMGMAMRALAQPEAADLLVDECLTLVAAKARAKH